MEFYPGFGPIPKRKYTKRNTVKPMTELEKWQSVNLCETQLQLACAIKNFADADGMIQGRDRKFEANKMIIGLKYFFTDEMPANVLTREYGIRQQAIYLKTFNK